MILYKGYFFLSNYIYLNESNKIILNEKEKKDTKALLLSSIPFDGKTCLLDRLVDNTFNENFLATIGIDYKILYYEYNKKKYQINIFDTAGQVRFRAGNDKYLKNVDILLFLFDLSIKNSIDIDYFNKVLGEINKKKLLIYLIGNKLDITKKYLFNYRKQAKSLYDKGKIDKYFEVSSKTSEGIDELKNILKIDSASIFDNLGENKTNTTGNLTSLQFKKFCRKNNINLYGVFDEQKLDKYLNY